VIGSPTEVLNAEEGRLMISLIEQPYRWVRRHAGDLLFERRYSIHTSGRIDLEDLGLADDERVYYIAANWGTLRRSLRGLHIGPEDVFVDIGSGLGRMVLEAARFPFHRVIGVELSERLHQAALENVGRSRMPRRCDRIELVCADALTYSLPDDASVVFLNNPFRGATFEAVARRIIESVDLAPRRLTLVYFNPVEEAFILSTGRFDVIRRIAPPRRSSGSFPFGYTHVYRLRA